MAIEVEVIARVTPDMSKLTEPGRHELNVALGFPGLKVVDRLLEKFWVVPR